MKKSKKLILTVILLITFFSVNTSVCRAEYEYWFWESLSEPFGLVSDVGAGACHGIGDCAFGFWKFVFGESKREPKQTDLPGNLPTE